MAKSKKEQDVTDAEVLSETGPEDESDHQERVEDDAVEDAEDLTDADAPPEPEESFEDTPYDDDLPEHEPVRSLSSRVLRTLAWIFLGFAIALWAAPRLAAILPAGMAPVAAFLAPGQSAQQDRLAARQAELEQRLTDLEQQEPPELDLSALNARVLQEVQSATEPLTAELADLRRALDSAPQSDLAPDIARLDTALKGALAEIEAVNSRLSTQITENGATLSAEAGAQLSELRLQIEGINGQITDLASQMGTLRARLEGAEKTAEDRAAAAEAQTAQSQRQARIQAGLSAVEEALANGQPYLTPLNTLRGDQMDIDDALASAAQAGAPDPAQLLSQFDTLARDAIAADREASSDGSLGNRIGSFLQTQIGARSVARRDGDDADAVLSRIEDDFRRGQYRSALSEAQTLSDAAKEPLSNWLSKVQVLADVHDALAALQTQAQEQRP